MVDAAMIDLVSMKPVNLKPTHHLFKIIWLAETSLKLASVLIQPISLLKTNDRVASASLASPKLNWSEPSIACNAPSINYKKITIFADYNPIHNKIFKSTIKLGKIVFWKRSQNCIMCMSPGDSKYNNI